MNHQQEIEQAAEEFQKEALANFIFRDAPYAFRNTFLKGAAKMRELLARPSSKDHAPRMFIQKSYRDCAGANWAPHASFKRLKSSDVELVPLTELEEARAELEGTRLELRSSRQKQEVLVSMKNELQAKLAAQEERLKEAYAHCERLSKRLLLEDAMHTNSLRKKDKLWDALDKIRDPRKRHKEPDAYTELACVMNIADEALAASSESEKK